MIEIVTQFMSAIHNIDWLNLLTTGGFSIGLSFLANFLYRRFRNRRLIEKRGNVVFVANNMKKDKLIGKIINVGLGLVVASTAWYFMPKFSIHIQDTSLTLPQTFSQLFFASLVFFMLIDLSKNYNLVTFLEYGFIAHRRFFYFEKIKSIQVGDSSTLLGLNRRLEIEIANHEMQVVLKSLKDPVFNIKIQEKMANKTEEDRRKTEVKDIKDST